jgi:beta-mannanase
MTPFRKARSFVYILILVSSFLIRVQSSVIAAPIYPPDTKLTSITVPTLARPAYLTPITDPTFGTKITRISDQTAFKDTYKALRHIYSKNQPWNSDGSLLMLGYEWSAHILDGNTYKYSRDINLGNMTPVWSNTQPAVIYARSTDGTSNANPTNQFLKVDVNTGQKTVLHTFTAYDFISIGEEEGNLTNDDHYVALMAKKGTATYALVYDIVNDVVVSTWDMGGKWPDWVGMSQSGNFVVMNWSTDGSARYQGLEVYDRNLVFQRQASTYGSHADMGYNTAGNEVIVSFASGISGATVIATRLDGGGRTTVIDKSPGFWAGHISCRNLTRPGWCYLSHGESNTGIVGYDETFALKLDGTQTVERFAHEHHVPLSQYYEEPQAVPNRDGSKVLFASNWDGGTVTYDYIAGVQSVTPTPSPIVTNTHTPTVTTTTVLPSVYSGAYLQGWQDDITKLTNFETMVGKPVSILHWFIAWGDTYKDFQTQNMNIARSNGSIPLVTWEPWNYSKLDATYSLSQIINGAHDAYITKWAQDAKAWKYPFFLRFAHEMDGDWYSWSEKINGNSAGQYVLAWKHVHDIFAREGVTNATWVWCPFREEANNIPVDGLYPGDAYVDWTCMDGYNWGTSQSWSKWETFNQIFQARYTKILQLAPNKPMMIAETGSAELGGSKSAWMQDAFTQQIPVNYPKIKAVVYFNRAALGSEPDWRIETTQTSTNAYKTALASTYYASNQFGTINTSPITALLSTNITPTNIPKSGDANGDGKVDGVDYIAWLNHYNPTLVQSGGRSIGDFNSDTKVDGPDYVIWLNNYGALAQ